MIKLLKWAWNKGEERSLERVLGELQLARIYHQEQARSIYLRDKYEPIKEEKDSVYALFQEPELSAKEHEIVARAFRDMMNRLRPPTQSEPINKEKL